MKRNALIAAIFVFVLALATTPVWAANPDKASFTNISTTPTSTMNGQNVNVTGTVNAGDNIDLSFTLGASGTGSTSTTYPDTLHLTATTIVKPPAADDVTVTGLTNCALSSRAATCSESATIVAPATPGAYQVKILADDGRSSGKMNSDFFFVNFTVVVPSCTPAATSLVLNTPACTLLHAGSVSLSATLTSGDTALIGKTITFYVDGTVVGTADTNSSGVATLVTYDPSSLGVGDHTVSAAWTPDDACYETPTVTGSTLGIEYLFLGFQQPINADGSSIFNGKSVPVKIKITDANGGVIPDANAFVYFENGIQSIVGTDPENVATGLNFDYGNVMRYDLTANQYVYNWDLSTTTNGTKTVRVFLNDGSCADPHQALISVGKKK